jgi:hypothetical protein
MAMRKSNNPWAFVEMNLIVYPFIVLIVSAVQDKMVYQPDSVTCQVCIELAMGIYFDQKDTHSLVVQF